MGFVYEKVREEDRELWESLGWKGWDGQELLFSKYDFWSIDREQNSYLIAIGGYIDMPTYYDFSYRNKIVRLEVFCKTEGNRVEGGVFNWKIKKMYIPKSIWDEKEQIMQGVINAFSVVNNGIPIEKTIGITVEIQCEPDCVEVDYNGK